MFVNILQNLLIKRNFFNYFFVNLIIFNLCDLTSKFIMYNRIISYQIIIYYK